MILSITTLYAQNDYMVYLEEANNIHEKISATDIKSDSTINRITTEHYIKKIHNSGTGFALGGDGLIVTNYHVIAGNELIVVRGINGNFSISYKAKIIISDIDNDLAILKIEDSIFKGIPGIPYNISLNADVGENIFVLGFPLRATMGEEIKLSNGIISASSGFQGDVKAFQISAPIQPGNSGGPLFNKSGHLIGIIKSKHLAAENVAYAIKACYLQKLIDLLPVAPVLNKKNKVTHMSLANQVKILNKYVYIIEIN